MKYLFRTLILHILILLARRRLRKSTVYSIAITGSVGKTTCRDAFVHLLSQKYKVLSAHKSYNTEFGVPLTILEEESGDTNIISWISIIIRGIKKSFQPIDATYLVLEYGVDKPGDMDTLLSIWIPHMSILTRIAPVHLADGQFSSPQDILKEKIKLTQATLAHGGIALLNSDDPLQIDFKKNYTTPEEATRTIWFSKTNDITSYTYDNKGYLHCAMNNHLAHLETIPCHFMGSWHLETILPALYGSLYLKLSKEDILQGMITFLLPPGRLSPIAGVQDILLIDSTYNASPIAVKETLAIFNEIQCSRRVFVFGNMNELGKKSKELHEDLAHTIIHTVDIFIGIGEGPSYTGSMLLSLGFPKENIFLCANYTEAIAKYTNIIEEKDVVLVKGSQNNVRLEYFVKAFMKDPSQASQLLVRQSPFWLST